MIETLKPFDVIASKYVDLNGELKTYYNGKPQKALFLVIAVDNGNVICCKITSQDTVYNHPDFTYTLRKESHSFLQIDSFIQLTKIQTLYVSSCTKVGEVCMFCRPAILNKFTSLFKTLLNIVSLHVPLSYISPNVSNPHTFGGVKVHK